VIRAMPKSRGAGRRRHHRRLCGPGRDRPQRELAAAVMSAAGEVVWVSRESDLDVVTALSGSGPAYFLFCWLNS